MREEKLFQTRVGDVKLTFGNGSLVDSILIEFPNTDAILSISVERIPNQDEEPLFTVSYFRLPDYDPASGMCDGDRRFKIEKTNIEQWCRENIPNWKEVK